MRFFALPEYLQYSVVFLNLIVLILNIYSLITSVVFRVKKTYIVTGALLTAVTSALLVFSCGANFEYRKSLYRESAWIKVFDLFTPFFVVGLVLLLSASVLLLAFVIRRNKNSINIASIKEGMDKLPAGLCYYSSDGVPRFINHRMDSLCRELTGEPLFDANALWQRLTEGNVLWGNKVEKTGYDPIITVADGNTLSFTKAERTIGGEPMYELRATDITTQYALYLELSEQNKQQLSLNRRLQEYGENVWDITREREILAAKVKIHDMLGKALLVTRRYIETGGADVKKEALTDIWNGTLYLFDGGFAELSSDGSLDELYEAAKLMGISVSVVGRIPADNRLLRFIMSGARECLTNAVHHAKARELTVTLYGSGSYFVIEYTNDGKRPDGSISEGGGLSSLRQSVEKDGGIMETDVVPQFVLRLKIPVKEVY